MDEVIFKIEVVEAAKAHVGKVLEVKATQRGAIHYSGGIAQLYGSVKYRGFDYSVRIFENKNGASMKLDAWPLRSFLEFNKIKFL